MSRSEGVTLAGVVKRYEGHLAVAGVSLEVPRGAFVTLLGPSGCGKSTLLRMISGFAEPTSGDIRIGGASVVGLPPYRRDTAMVFQDYALFPHRTVEENLAFGLRIRRMDKPAIRARVAAMLEMLGLAGLGGRRVSEISGGQAQRVALGRALVVEPAVLLLDEPLGALDLKLRKQMQAELKRLHRELGLTFIAVTHDQEEALNLSDFIAVMNAGRIEQYGTPEEVYARPATRFVADFVGEANLVPATVEPDGLRLEDGTRLPLPEGGPGAVRAAAGAAVTLAVRPEAVEVHAAATGTRPGLAARVEEVLYSGAARRVIGRTAAGTRLTSLQPGAAAPPERGSLATFSWAPAASWIIPA
ncbi:ABC transporter ATP-binding protein [Ancylobacter lacus]|uniref:ABC transporter ATP-binding protein n=1 Tax=Ancylobacter lacus TaxID=2579970 RepID=UPI001BCE08DA|nr:ABC transporter ATP-binding protein [Ancylobacter lacus]MBS7538245.1 ABC transporter ATP-binding protein [Ancylobacter lacus]